MKLTINKLFGTKDISIDFKNRMNILIGENGTCKSTVLKIINYLTKRDFISLQKIKFQTIVFEVDEKKEIIHHEDISPIASSNKPGFNLMLKDCISSYDYSKIKKNWKNIERKTLMEEFEIFYNDFCKKTEKLLKYGDCLEDNRWNLTSYIKEVESLYFPNVISKFEQTLLKFRSLFENTKPVLGSKIYIYNLFVFNIITKCHDKSETISDYIVESWSNRGDNFKFIFDYYLALGEFTNYSSDKQYYDYTQLKDKKKLGYKIYNFEVRENIIKDMNDKLLDYDKDDVNKVYDLEMFLNSTKVKNLFKMLFAVKKSYFLEVEYTISFTGKDDLNDGNNLKAEEVLKEFMSHLKPVNDNKVLLEEYAKAKLKPYDLLEKLYDYIQKGVHHEFYDMDNKYFYYEDIPFPYNYEKLYNFIEDEYEELMSILRDFIPYIKFKKLIKKYIKNKNIDLIYDYDGGVSWEVTDIATGTVLNEESLSSGEIKIIRLIIMLCFLEEESYLLLDEPELSLSIYWQKMLLDDIYENSKSKFIGIATQSPSMINENHIPFLIEMVKE